MIKHLIRIAAITLVLGLCIIYPFLPGQYDSLAMPLSTMAQASGVLGLLLVPIGIVWLIYELRRQARLNKQDLPIKGSGFVFAVVALIAASLVALAVAVVALATIGPSAGLLTLALWITLVIGLIPKLKSLKNAVAGSFNPAPLYLIVIPLALLGVQMVAAAPMTASSRSHAISASAEMVEDIEAYHEEYGRYPNSLVGVWKDYYPNVVGVEKYHYRPEGEGYNLFFEQPRFLFDNIGTREFVVYNPLDEHFMVSHPSFMLLLTPAEFESSPGWYEVNDAPSAHWKYFWFD